MKKKWIVVLSCWLVAAGCAAIAGIEETTTVADAPEATTDATTPDVATDATTSDDGGIDSGEIETPDAAKNAADASSCPVQIRPVKAEAIKTANGVVCGDPNRLLDGGNTLPVGLDYDPVIGGLSTRWGAQGQAVHGCVGVQFDAGITSVLVRARMVDSACGQACTGTGCNSYHYYGAWIRQADGGMELVDIVNIDFDNLTDTVVALADGGVVVNPYVAICRTSLALYREDIDVRYIAGCP